MQETITNEKPTNLAFETTTEEVPRRAPATIDVTFRHSGWQPTRRRVLAALRSTGQGQHRLERFLQCGSGAIVERTGEEPRRYRIRCFRCHDRWCVPCACERSRIIARNLKTKLLTNPHRLVTLTLKSTNQPLHQQICNLIERFRELRATKWWTARVAGGAWFLEVTNNQKTRLWHPHLHVITEGDYIDQRRLSALWNQITNGSFIVDVRLIRDNDTTANYVAKYTSKSLTTTAYQHHDLLCEAVTALTGIRLCNTFGRWRRFKLLDHTQQCVWETYLPLWLLIYDANQGDTSATNILGQLRLQQPTPTTRDPPTDSAARTP